MSVGVLALVCGLLADGTRPGQVWRLLAPSMALVVALGCAAVWAVALRQAFICKAHRLYRPDRRK